jgi:hypothetical protein
MLLLIQKKEPKKGNSKFYGNWDCDIVIDPCLALET